MSVTKIVILNWNTQHHLRLFLPSVIAHTPSEVDIIVADNGSSDSSVAMLRTEFPGIEILELEYNYGYAEGYNRALRHIEADYYVLINSDIQVRRGWLEPLIQTIEADNSIAAIAPKILSYQDQEKFEYAGASGGYIDFLGYPFCRGRILSHIEKDRGQYDDLRQVFWASGACMVVRSKTFHELEGFDPWFFAHMEEIDFCWRAQLYGYKIMVDPRSSVYHLGGGTLPNNSPNKLYLNFRNNLAMLHKNMPKGWAEIVLLTRMLLDGVSAAVFLLQGKPKFFNSVIKAHIEYYKRIPQLKSDRRKILKEKVCSMPKDIYKGSIILRYMLGQKRFDNLL